ncbi:hypothetical protein U1701_17865 [Sphingomonas sp. PB2P19]|uniref:hypothetical protein n=1 Tax=Sphingomonas rhamnosi TaxID=3096156 RepID=UPI002FCBF198
MITLSVGGLVLDLVGVMMLGADLVRVQWKLREDASDRISALTEVMKAAGGMDAFLKSISGDFREYYRDEGAYFPSPGTFDPDAARQSLDEMKDGINGLADNLATVARMMVATVENDEKTAGMSLTVTYTGLGLIIAGFTAQAAGYFW